MCVCVRERESVCVCVCERDADERERESVVSVWWVRVCVCVRACVCVRLTTERSVRERLLAGAALTHYSVYLCVSLHSHIN